MVHHQATSQSVRGITVFHSQEKAEKERTRKQAKRQQWGRVGVVIPAEGTTSAKILSTKESWHIPELIEGHKKQGARAGRCQMRQGRQAEARWHRLTCGGGDGDRRRDGVSLQKLTLFPCGEEVDLKEARYWE